MMTHNESKNGVQALLFQPLLKNMISLSHPLVKLADAMDWEGFAAQLQEAFCADNGRPSCPVRLMVGLQYLKYAYDLSDEAVLEQWVENPYWQYFCGEEFFCHEAPTDQSTMSRWRKKLSVNGAEELLKETLLVGLQEGFVRPAQLERVNVDTTVQEKEIRHPTDARLYDRMRERLVSTAKAEGIPLRQGYARVSRKLLRKQNGYAHARQFKRAAKCVKKLKGILGRVVRDIQRKCPHPSGASDTLLADATRLLEQTRKSKQKLYSVHEPQVECICKGKAHKKYEFGVKVSVATTSNGNWVVGAQACPGNPYDGHTLRQTLAQVARIVETEPKMAVCDLGYRGHDYEGACDIQIVKRYRKTIPRRLRSIWKRRSAIEPVIGHLKEDHRLNRNRLGGRLGDKLNVLFAAAGFNLRKLLRAYALFLRAYIQTLYRWLFPIPEATPLPMMSAHKSGFA